MSRLPEFFDLLADPVHGSSVLVGEVAMLLADVGKLTEEAYVELARALTLRRPEFALLHHLLHSVGRDCYQSRRSPDIRSAARAWLSAWANARRSIKGPTFPLTAPLTLVTWSHSGTLLIWLKKLSRAHPDLAVHCAISEPDGEGEVFAEELVRAGLTARAVADEAALDLASRCSLVAVGADALRPGEFWNKAGTRELLVRAANGGRPFAVVTEAAKWCHPAWSLALAPALEVIDNKRVTCFINELGEMLPAQLESLLPAPPLYAPLMGPPVS